MTRIYDLVIIGSGPAGLSAAVYAQRAQLNAVTVEKAPLSGGQVLTTNEVDNYPGFPSISGFDLSMKLRKHADDLLAVFITDTVNGISQSGGIIEVLGQKNRYKTRSVIIATGAVHKKLEIPGEEKFSGRGVSYCATCDGMFFKDKTAAIAGGGDVALEDAAYLSRICKKVYIIHRRDTFRGAKSLQEKVFNRENIEIMWNTEVREIKGTDFVSEIIIENNKTNEKKALKTDALFVAVGVAPVSGIFKNTVETDSGGYIITNDDGETSVKGIYAAGDVTKKNFRQIITAANDGANCVASIEKYLQEIPALT